MISRPLDGGPRESLRLDPVDGLLYRAVEGLDAEAEAVDSHRPCGGDVVLRQAPRIRLDANLGVGGHPEPIVQVGPELPDLLGGEEGGRATAPMNLRDGTLGGQQGGKQVNLPLQVAEVLRNPLRIVGHLHVTAAIVAELSTEGQVHVERERGLRRRSVRPHYVCPEGPPPHRLGKVGSGGITRVAGKRLVVSSEKIEIDVHIRGLEFQNASGDRSGLRGGTGRVGRESGVPRAGAAAGRSQALEADALPPGRPAPRPLAPDSRS